MNEAIVNKRKNKTSLESNKNLEKLSTKMTL